ncbi:MAG: hypothetical protein SGJ26_12045 [Nitrospirota bacterium]|nr:hypothetical protein [Nitrospirota bacterium]
MKWLFFPFSLLKRARGAEAAVLSEPAYSATEEYVSRLVNLPLPVVSTIYRAGRPWPVSLDDFDRVAQQEAADLHCSLDQARLIVMKRMQWQRANSDCGGAPMDLAAYRTWHRHRERVAQRLKEEVATVTKVHHGVLKYRWQEGKTPD